MSRFPSRRRNRSSPEVSLSLNAFVFVVNVAGAVIASVAIVPLRNVASLSRAPGLRRAWWMLTLIMLCCIGLLLAVALTSTDKPLAAADFAETGIHILGPCFVLGVAWLSHKTAQSLLRIEILEEAAFVDPLTGLGNRRRFDECLPEEVRRARQIDLPLSVLVLDIDHFKRVNDTYGHGVGDRVLKQVATVIAARTRHSDTVCRVGGEEFVVIMPGLDGAFVEVLAERLRRAVAETGLALDGGGEVQTSVSLGVATLRPGETADLLLRRADAALYRAKRDGRDRLCLAA